MTGNKWEKSMNYTIGDSVFNDWLITGKIGEGATGKVFEIEKNDSMIQAKSALKVIRIPKSASDVREIMSEGMDEMSVTQYFREFVDEILREIKIMVSLKDHPNIVAYEDHSVIAHEDGVGWDILIKMELLTPLSDWLFENPVDEDTVIRLGCEISSALAYAIDSGLVHRDVKPENIFVDHMGRFKLGDFGIARTIEKTTGGLSKKGTENYMAPEVYLGKPYNEQIDIYSLGIVLYRLMNNNRLPFYPPITEKISFSDREAARTKRIQGEPIPAPCNGSKEFQAIILKACEYLPENRYESMHELYNALQQLKKTDRVIPQMPNMTKENGTERTNWSVTRSKSVTGSFTGKTGETSVTGSFGNTASGSMVSGGAVAENGKGGSGTGKKVAIAAGVILAVGIGGYAVHYHIEASRTYDVVVENGTGAGSYKAGEAVTLTAAEPEYGYLFDGWEVTEGDLADVDLGEESISFTMPKTPIELTATYKEKICSLTVTNGNGSGEYAVGDAVSVQADEPEYGYEFTGWTVADGTLEDVDLTVESLDFDMPDSELALTADYTRSTQQLVVNHGSITDGENTGYCNVGDSVSVQPDEADYGYVFSGWEVVAGTLDGVDLTQENLNFEMPDSYVELTANYTQIICSVTVNNGSGSGEYGVGDLVSIQANDPEYGYVFAGWEDPNGVLTDVDLSSPQLDFAMPNAALDLTAVYTRIMYSVTVNNGNGSGEYGIGDMVTIQANDPEYGYAFSGWEITNGSLADGDLSSSTLTFTMPDSAVELTAQYQEADGEFTWQDENGDTYTGYRQAGMLEGYGTKTASDGKYTYEGEFVNGKYEGNGKLTYTNGDYYEGTFVNDEFTTGKVRKSYLGDVYEGTWKNGHRSRGTLTYSNGDVYKGTFKEDDTRKKGTLTYSSGAVYEGRFSNDKFNTKKGKYTWANGNVYEGTFKDGKRTGKGKFTWADGDVYEGDFVDGARTGTGKYSWPNGDVYEGDFVDDEPAGTGTYTWAAGTVYTGDLVNGKFSGTGTKNWPNGAVYVGEWSNDRRNGNGTMTYADGAVYVGEWSNDRRNGNGTMTYADGTVYVGAWVDDSRTGTGKMTWGSRTQWAGDVYEGAWLNDERTGYGKYTYANGYVEEGRYVNGVLQ